MTTHHICYNFWHFFFFLPIMMIYNQILNLYDFLSPFSPIIIICFFLLFALPKCINFDFNHRKFLLHRLSVTNFVFGFYLLGILPPKKTKKRYIHQNCHLLSTKNSSTWTTISSKYTSKELERAEAAALLSHTLAQPTALIQLVWKTNSL